LDGAEGLFGFHKGSQILADVLEQRPQVGLFLHGHVHKANGSARTERAGHVKLAFFSIHF
jgi:Icc-related predicted phosphoesterase